MTTTSTSPKPTKGRIWAYLGATLGGGVSIAANVAHSFLPPAGAPDTWQPEPGAVVGAIVWPVFLFIAVEILVRISWPTGKAWLLLRFGGLLPVAGVAAFVSYRHLSGLLAHYGEEPVVVLVGPIAVDGLMLMATGALLAISHRARAAADAAVVIAAPVAAAPVVPAAVPGVPPVAAPAVAVSAADVAPVVDTPAVPVVAAPTRSAVVPVPAAAVPPVPVTVVESAIPAPAVKRPTPARAPSTTGTRVTVSDAASPVAPVPAAMLARATHIARAHLSATGQPITANELAVRMHVGSAMAGQLLAAMDAHPDNPTTPAAALNGSAVTAAR